MNLVQYLGDCGMKDPCPDTTKYRRPEIPATARLMLRCPDNCSSRQLLSLTFYLHLALFCEVAGRLLRGGKGKERRRILRFPTFKGRGGEGKEKGWGEGDSREKEEKERDQGDLAPRS